MPSHMFKSIMKVLVIHVSYSSLVDFQSRLTDHQQLNVTTGQGDASLTDVISLLASKLACNGAEAWLVPTMSNILTCIRASHHPAVYDSLFDAYVAVSRLLDLGWNRGMVVPANNIKLRSIRDEIVTLMEAMTFREAEIYTGRAPEVIGTFPVRICTEPSRLIEHLRRIIVLLFLETFDTKHLLTLSLHRRQPELVIPTWILTRCSVFRTKSDASHNPSGRGDFWPRSSSKNPRHVPLLELPQKFVTSKLANSNALECSKTTD